MELRPELEYNEITQYMDARWVCAPKALWKVYQFPFTQTRMRPSIGCLQLHLPNKQQIRHQTSQFLEDVVSNARNFGTMLTKFFHINVIELEARKYLYVEFPKYYWWIDTTRSWWRRQTNQRVLGRIYNVIPTEGERFYLRLLLNHIWGPQSFKYLRVINGITCLTFRAVAEKLGLTVNDDSI